MKLILIGNYELDRQESMKLFANMLQSGFIAAGIPSEIWLPTVCFGSFSKSTTNGLGKWLGYLDKWMVFPLILWFRANKKENRNSATVFHICDHSNSPYLNYLPGQRVGITCHDVLAIRGALGFQDAYCNASRFGIILQKWILSNLVKAKKLASVSELTLKQLRELNKGLIPEGKDWRVIPNAFNRDFRRVAPSDCKAALQQMGLPMDVPYILHLGSALPRKNRGVTN